MLNKIKEKIQDIKDERMKTSVRNVSNFAKANRNCVIFAMDTKTDDLIACYREKYMAARVMNKFLGIKTKKGVVKSILLEKKKTRRKDENIIVFEKFCSEFLWKISEKLEDKKGRQEDNNKSIQEHGKRNK